MTKEITVDELTKEWSIMHCCNLAMSTQRAYTKYCNLYILPHIGDMKVESVRQCDIQSVVNNVVKKGFSSKSQKNLIGILHNIFEYGIINGFLKYNPCKMISINKTSPYEYNIYTEEQYQQLLDYCKNSIEIVPILLAGICGLRLSEVLGLRWSDINFENKSLHVHSAAVALDTDIDLKATPKTAAGNRIIAVPQIVMKYLLKYYPGKDGFVYPSRQDPNKPEHGKYYYGRFKRMLKRAGLPHTRFHDLRHFAATSFLDAGVPDKYAAAYLGHSDTNMTRKYQHIRQQVIPYPMMSDNVIKIVNC